MFFVKQFFPGADRDVEPVLKRRQWTGPILVIGAIWIVGHVEINQRIVRLAKAPVQGSGPQDRFPFRPVN